MAKLKQGKICEDCGSTEKYDASGRCRPCSLVTNWGRRGINEPNKPSITPEQTKETIEISNKLLTMRM
mgnify:CR=1 FL=1